MEGFLTFFLFCGGLVAFVWILEGLGLGLGLRVRVRDRVRVRVDVAETCKKFCLLFILR